jgi:nicotinate-nucleotide adenylyltransferase
MNRTELAEPIALLGGTFDPVHYGHLKCADEARRKLSLETLFLLPAATPVHRDEPGATAAQRLEMLRLARSEFPSLSIDTHEIERGGPSYMVDTLSALRSEHPDHPLVLLLGQDAANRLHTWHCWEQLFELAHLVVLTRPGEREGYRHDIDRQVQRRKIADQEGLRQSLAGAVLQFPIMPVDISATTIKSIIRLGRSPRGMLPDAVLDYIDREGLYRTR